MNAAKDVTILPASSMLMFNAVSWNVWNELPPDLQQLLVDSTGHEASVRSGRLLYDATNKDLETMRRAGISIHELTPVQEGAFRQAERQMTVDNWRAALKSGGLGRPRRRNPARLRYGRRHARSHGLPLNVFPRHRQRPALFPARGVCR